MWLDWLSAAVLSPQHAKTARRGSRFDEMAAPGSVSPLAPIVKML
jgi:hypothetical protein